MDPILSNEFKVFKNNNISKLQPSTLVKEMEQKCPKIYQYYPGYHDMAIFYASVIPLMEPDVSRMVELALFGIWILLFKDQIDERQECSGG